MVAPPDAICSEIVCAIWAAKASVIVQALEVHKFDGGCLCTLQDVFVVEDEQARMQSRYNMHD